MPRPVEEQLRKTYFSLRIGVAVLGILLPFLLWIGGKVYGLSLRPSMSDYYWATPDTPTPPSCDATSAEKAARPAGSMRNWFVGVLFAVGSMLFVNKGSSDRENVALSIGGALAVGIAVFPMQTFCAANGKVSVHGACAVSFFLCIAYICVFCADETLKFILDEKKRQQYRNAYRTLAIVMVASPAVAVVFNALTLQQSSIFYVELLGILSFGVFWLVKSREIALITEERKSGKLDARLPAPV
jgi:hypothetical protein